MIVVSVVAGLESGDGEDVADVVAPPPNENPPDGVAGFAGPEDPILMPENKFLDSAGFVSVVVVAVLLSPKPVNRLLGVVVESSFFVSVVAALPKNPLPASVFGAIVLVVVAEVVGNADPKLPKPNEDAGFSSFFSSVSVAADPKLPNPNDVDAGFVVAVVVVLDPKLPNGVVVGFFSSSFFGSSLTMGSEGVALGSSLIATGSGLAFSDSEGVGAGVGSVVVDFPGVLVVSSAFLSDGGVTPNGVVDPNVGVVDVDGLPKGVAAPNVPEEGTGILEGALGCFASEANPPPLVEGVDVDEDNADPNEV